MRVRRSVPDVSEGAERHDEDGDHALDGRDHRVSGTRVVGVVRLEDDVESWKQLHFRHNPVILSVIMYLTV